MKLKQIFDRFDWRKNYKFRIASGVVGLSVILFMIFKEVKQDLDQGNYLTYSEMINAEDYILAEIIQISAGKVMAQVKFSDGMEKYTRFARNLSYRPPDIEYFLKKGDKIIKPAGIDTLRVLRGDSVFYFVINKTIDLKGEINLSPAGEDIK
jgi:hypothetical protein